MPLSVHFGTDSAMTPKRKQVSKGHRQDCPASRGPPFTALSRQGWLRRYTHILKGYFYTNLVGTLNGQNGNFRPAERLRKRLGKRFYQEIATANTEKGNCPGGWSRLIGSYRSVPWTHLRGTPELPPTPFS
jgi:hypothetical protein